MVVVQKKILSHRGNAVEAYWKFNFFKELLGNRTQKGKKNFVKKKKF